MQSAQLCCRYLTKKTQFAGQITQWDLIFHGTDDPVQPNDPPRKPKSGLELSYGGELGHNSLEFDSDPASGMWRDMQQVI